MEKKEEKRDGETEDGEKKEEVAFFCGFHPSLTLVIEMYELMVRQWSVIGQGDKILHFYE